MPSMDWVKLMSSKRIGDKRRKGVFVSYRSPYQQDFDRIIFSSAFRRLQDKTQVFPFSESDYVRTRLTHSLEAACVGRSLGRMVGEKIIKKFKLKKTLFPSDFGDVVSAACLAHDIGNPPFGHSGEDAIQNWFSSSNMGKALVSAIPVEAVNDLTKFEGNAQGFRILTRLQFPANIGGMKLTCATLAAFTKYPRSSVSLTTKYSGIMFKKHGFNLDDSNLFEEVADETGLLKIGKSIHPMAWARHPLAFLVEAADDICYSIIDLEDGFRLGLIQYEEVRSLLIKFINDKKKKYKIENRIGKFRDEKNKVELLRASSIGEIVQEVGRVFIENMDKILVGSFDDELLKNTDHSKEFFGIKKFDKDQVYPNRKVIEIEAAGFEVLAGLLNEFCSAIEDVTQKDGGAQPKHLKLFQLIPDQFIENERKPKKNPYKRILKITDFVSGMTDSHAVSVFKKIKGISLPTM